MTYRQLLRGNPDFRRLWTGQVVSEIGDWLNNIAVLALVIELAGERRVGLAIAVYAITRHLPLFIFGPIAGVVVDRADRRRVMMAADVLRAALALGFLVADRVGSLALIYVVGSSLFCVSAFFNAAKRASIPNLVGRTDELLTANSLSASTAAATIAIGSALGGLVATFIGRDVVFVANAVTFLVSADMIRRIRAATRSGDHQQHSFHLRSAPVEGTATTLNLQRLAATLRHAATEFRDGLSYVRREETLFAVFVVAACWGLGNGAARALYSIFGARLGIADASGWVERPSDFGISVLFVAMGLGGVLGAPLARRFNQAAGDSLGSRMGRSLLFDGFGLALFSVTPSLWTASLVLVAREMNFAVWWTAQQTIIMRRTADTFAGRVFASFETLTTLMMVGSMFASGAAADTYGIRPVAIVAGAVISCSGLLWFALRRRRTAMLSSFR